MGVGHAVPSTPRPASSAQSGVTRLALRLRGATPRTTRAAARTR
ncbi:Hypothetical protein CAP_0088 [Chondromyces apiculatus DSM 436]|uniref:Uncharacterized protein n=1 Tax=Chondromyces apiculatus DSM 436 TaxID=1192034 RepID=A0A017TES8_9BACT|nr:Hypothetical protein CAP_0088 [Chondromyces apiculatus DSM 436]